jgi:hypothetical protein
MTRQLCHEKMGTPSSSASVDVFFFRQTAGIQHWIKTENEKNTSDMNTMDFIESTCFDDIFFIVEVILSPNLYFLFARGKYARLTFSLPHHLPAHENKLI